jgi:hypothetical protein
MHAPGALPSPPSALPSGASDPASRPLELLLDELLPLEELALLDELLVEPVLLLLED